MVAGPARRRRPERRGGRDRQQLLQDIAIVRAGNGYQPDLHAFQISPQGTTALFTVYDAIRCNLSAYGGPADGAVADTLFQEIDLRTGLVRFEWHALDHVALADSYMPVSPGTPISPWDYFHINAVSEQGRTCSWTRATPGRLTTSTLAAARSPGASAASGRAFTMEPGASPAWQHDAREEPDGTISFFDNGGTPKVHSQSRVIVLALNKQTMTATLVSSFVHPTPLLAASQGDFQPLTVATGSSAGARNRSSRNSRPAVGCCSTRICRPLPVLHRAQVPLVGDPAQGPGLAVRAGSHGGVVAYASWNGATAVTQWRLLAGASAHALAPVATATRNDFETAIPTRPRRATWPCRRSAPAGRCWARPRRRRSGRRALDEDRGRSWARGQS